MSDKLSTSQRILILTHCYPRYAGDVSGIFIQNSKELLEKEGYQIKVLAPKMPKFKVFLPIYLLLYFLRAVTTSADLIWAHWLYPSGLIGAVVRRFRRKILMVHCHGTDVNMALKSKFYAKLANWVIDRADAVLVASNDLLDKVLRLTKPSFTEIWGTKDSTEPKFFVLPMPVSKKIGVKKEIKTACSPEAQIYRQICKNHKPVSLGMRLLVDLPIFFVLCALIPVSVVIATILDCFHAD